MTDKTPKPDGVNRSLTVSECAKEMVHLAYHYRSDAEAALRYSQIALNLLQVDISLRRPIREKVTVMDN